MFAYRRTKLTTGTGRRFDQDFNTSAHAAALAAHRRKPFWSRSNPPEAVLELRESLSIRQKTQPDDWTTFDTRSMLGEALSELKSFSDAEPLLLSSYKGLAERANTIPTRDKPRLTRALERLVELYEAMGNRDEAMKWRKAATNPADALPSP